LSPFRLNRGDERTVLTDFIRNAIQPAPTGAHPPPLIIKGEESGCAQYNVLRRVMGGKRLSRVMEDVTTGTVELYHHCTKVQPAFSRVDGERRWMTAFWELASIASDGIALHASPPMLALLVIADRHAVRERVCA
jgi:hypothetical protein